MGKVYQKWAEEEIATLKAMYQGHPTKEIALILNRSTHSVRSKAKELDFNRWWTTEEVELLKQICGEYPSHMIHKIYNQIAAKRGFKPRSKKAITAKAASNKFSLKLTCSFEYYTPAILAELFGIREENVLSLIKTHPELSPNKHNRNYYIHQKSLRRFFINNPGFVEKHKDKLDMVWVIEIISS